MVEKKVNQEAAGLRDWYAVGGALFDMGVSWKAETEEGRTELQEPWKESNQTEGAATLSRRQACSST